MKLRSKRFKIKLKLIIMALAFIFLFSAYTLITFLYLRGPIIYLKEGTNYEVDYRASYIDPGYKTNYLYVDLTDSVEVFNLVDTHKLGTYDVIYKLHFNGNEFKKIRKVKVTDLSAPVITFNEDSYACPGGEFIETGYDAIDNLDGNVKDKVKVNKSHDTWVYEVTDSSGNKAIVKRKIRYEDKKAPEIVLNSPNTNVYINSNYTDPGYQVKDNCSSEPKVVVSGTVDTSKVGKYVVTYEVSDESGNATKVERTVNVVNRPVFVNNAIYLTFDDGPSANITPQILDILKEEGAKATFFVNDRGRGLDYLIKRAVDEGHTVASHTSSHNYNTVYASETSFFNEVDSVLNIIYNATGKRNKIFRFPGGSSNTVSRFNPGIMTRLVNLADSNGYLFYDWTIDSNDAGGARSSEEVYNNVIKYMGYQSLNVVLMHDSSDKYATLGALRDIIRYGKNNGFNFLPITETTPQARHHVNN